jgi:hypothetical protein
LGRLLQEYLHEAQKVNGADDVYLFSSIMVASPDKATEQFSSRLRALIVVFLGGVVAMFGAVSMARSMAAAKERRLLLSPDAAGGKRRRRAVRGSSDIEVPQATPDSAALAPPFDIEFGLNDAKTLVQHGRRLSGAKQ